MKLILLTNDDGIYSQGVLALRRELAGLGRIELIAPQVETSGASHTISIDRPLRLRPAYMADELIGHTVNGSPADCVKVGVTQHLNRPPDLLVSGVNLGANVGVNVLYSGTVAAAIEGAMLNVPSMAFSLATRVAPDFAGAARIARRMVEKLWQHPMPPRTMLNINIPPLPEADIRGVRLTRQSLQPYVDGYDMRTDPRGDTYYWIDGKIDLAAEPDDTDVAALRDGYISVTPLSYDMTWHGNWTALEDIKEERENR